MKLIDKYNRVHDYLRISLTDKCNYNCLYCNPNKDLKNNHTKSNILTYEENLRLIKLFAEELEFKKFRFTGGEPLVRKNVYSFFDEVKKLKDQFGFKLGITTNGSLLQGNVNRLLNSGFDTINISLDSLNPAKFYKITQRHDFENVISAIEEVNEVGLNPVKVNTVVIRGINDDEILNFIDYVKDKNINLRFIEYMPFTDNQWMRDGFMSYKEIKNKVESVYKLRSIKSDKNSVAKDYGIVGYTGKVSFISSISDHFCNTCNRVRVSSTGKFRLCLFSEGDHELNFKTLFREGLSNNEIYSMLNNTLRTKWEKHPEPEVLAEQLNNNMLKIGG